MKQSGDTIGAFTIIETVHHEGGTDYYHALRKGLGGFTQQVLLHHIPDTPNVQSEHWLANAKTSGLLSHTNIIQVLDIKSIDDGWYIAMESVTGPSLKELIKKCSDRRHLLPISQALYITLEILSALHYAHNRGLKRGNLRQKIIVTHNDIRPENVLIDMQGGIKLWGFAKEHPPKTRTAFHPAEPRLDIRSDIYSVAALLIYMLTGKSPHQWSQPLSEDAETEQSYTLITPEALRQARPDIDSGLIAIITQALSHHPSDRFQSAAALKEALQKHIDASILLTSSIALAALLADIFEVPKEVDEVPTIVSKTMPITDILSQPLVMYKEQEPSTIAHLVLNSDNTSPKISRSNLPPPTLPKLDSRQSLESNEQTNEPNIIPTPPPIRGNLAQRLILTTLWIFSVALAFFVGIQLRPKVIPIDSDPTLIIVMDEDSNVQVDDKPVQNNESISVESDKELVLTYEKENIRGTILIPPLQMNEIRHIDLRAPIVPTE